MDRRPWDRLVARDPHAFLIACRDRYLETISDYRCLFRKLERSEGVLQPEEHIRIRFRESPYSVDMKWIKNARRAARLTYVRGRWTSGDKELAHIQPTGVLGLFAPLGVKRDIHGPDVAKEARGTVDQFRVPKYARNDRRELPTSVGTSRLRVTIRHHEIVP